MLTVPKKTAPTTSGAVLLSVDLFKRAIAGEFNYDNFLPKWVDKETFNRLKDKDGYIKYIWSFGSAGLHYMYNSEREKIKKAEFDFIFKNKNEIEKRRKIKTKNNKMNIAPRLDRLQSLECFKDFKDLEITNKDYREYQHKNGDVVYCDIPYEATEGYKAEFQVEEFYNWADSRDYPVYFSSYPIKDKRFKLLWARKHRSTYNDKLNSKLVMECLYSNGKEI